MAGPRYHIVLMSSARHPFLQRWLRSVILLLALAAGPVAADQSDPGLDSLFDELKRTGNTAEADRLTAEIWQRWVAHGSDRRAGELMRLGMNLMNSGLLAQAEQVFNALIDERPDFAEAWNKRATIRFLQGDDAGSREPPRDGRHRARRGQGMRSVVGG